MSILENEPGGRDRKLQSVQTVFVADRRRRGSVFIASHDADPKSISRATETASAAGGARLANTVRAFVARRR